MQCKALVHIEMHPSKLLLENNVDPFPMSNSYPKFLYETSQIIFKVFNTYPEFIFYELCLDCKECRVSRHNYTWMIDYCYWGTWFQVFIVGNPKTIFQNNADHISSFHYSYWLCFSQLVFWHKEWSMEG